MVFKSITANIKSILETIGIVSDDEKEDKLRLESHKVLSFSGKSEDWQKWKTGTKVTFSSTGYSKILEDKSYAIKHKAKNKIVYAQLSGAVNDGTARHLVDAHESTQDGHQAWKDLLSWYDGSKVQAALAASLRKQIQSLKLHTGTTASSYINSFKLKKIRTGPNSRRKDE